MNREVYDYEDACKLNRSDLERKLVSFMDSLISADNLSDYHDALNCISAYSFRLAEIKGLFYK